MGDIALRGNRLTFAKGGRAGYAIGSIAKIAKKGIGKLRKPPGVFKIKGKKPSTHAKAIPTQAAEGGRIGLKKGGKPWGTGPKPGTHEFLEHHLHKPRKGKAIGGAIQKVIQGGKKIISKIKKKPKTETWKTLDVPGMPGPHKGKYPTIDKVMKNLEAQKKKGVVNPHYTGKAAGGRIGLKKGKRVPERPKEREWRGWTKRDPRRPSRPKRGRELTGDDPIIKSLAGGVKGKPHSSKEGRYASAKRKFGRMIDDTKYDPNPFKPKKTWPPKHSDLLQRYPKMPQPHRSPGDTPHIPMPKHDPNKPKKWKEAAEGGRIGLKKGGSDKKWIQKAVDPKHKGYCTPMTKKTCTPARKALARTFKKKAKTGWG